MAPLRPGGLRGAALWAAFASASASVLAFAAPGAAPEVTAEPAKVLLGFDPAVEIQVRAEEIELLKAHAGSGTLSERRPDGPGAVRFTWTPPDVRYPLMAVLIFWIEQDARPPEVTVLRIPLVGRTELEVNTEARAEVRVEIGKRTFGPRRANSRGQVKVPVEVPPGIQEARVLSEAAGRSSSRVVPLTVPATNSLSAVTGPEPIPRSGGWAWLVSAAGRLDLATLGVEASGGSISLARSEPDRALFSVRPSPGARSVSMTFRTTGVPEDLATVGVDVDEPPLPPARPQEPVTPRLSPAITLGGAYAGGANLSARLALEVDLSIPVLGFTVAAGLSLEGRAMGLSSRVAGLGTLDSQLLAFAPLVIARVRVLELGAVALHIRAGAGPLFFLHRVGSDFQPSVSEGGVTSEAFVGVQLGYRLGPLDLLLDLRASSAVVQTRVLDANMGGLVIGCGARMSR